MARRYGLTMDYQRVVVPGSIEPKCPAAQLVAEAAGGTGCVCRITNSLLDSRHDPTVLAVSCFHATGYQDCAVWRTDRDAYLRSRRVRDLLNSEGDFTEGHPEDRERDRGLALAIDAQERGQWESARERER